MKKLLFIFVFAFVALLGEAQILIQGNISTNTTWTNDNIYILVDKVKVLDGATLTIEPGTIIKGDFNSKGALVIERGGKLMAEGTVEQPIVFTSQRAPGQRAYGDWGGIILCGRASLNQPANPEAGTEAGTALVEGGVGSTYGGGTTPDDNDNSGILRYVRIEFGGIPFLPNNEINGLTMAAVGRGTVIENIQVSYCGDDAFEWFGGTVNCKNLIAYRNWDDDFDSDNGWNGNVQFALSMRDPAIADQSGSNGFESDNDGQGTTNTPNTNGRFSNVTILGPLVYNSTINTLYRRAAHLRRNTGNSIFNSVLAGYPVGLLIESSSTQAQATSDFLRVRNTAIVQMNDSLAAATSANPNNTSGSFNISNWFGTTGWGNSLIGNASELAYISMDLNNPDLRLQQSSPLFNQASFTDSYLNNPFFTPVNYIGAFGNDDWTSCWAEWDPQNADYSQAIDNTVLASLIAQGATEFCEGETVTLVADSDHDGVVFRWNNGTVGQSIVADESGEYSVYAETVDNCLSEVQSLSITVNQNPSVEITAQGSTVFCTGGSVQLTSSFSSGNVWNTGATTPSITVNETGDYTLVYTDANGCSDASNTISVSVSDSPIPSVAINGDNEICAGSTVELVASTSETYVWSLNGEIIENASASSLDASQEGLYTVTVTNTDACLGVGTSLPVFVNVLPSPTASGSADQALGSLTVEFNNESINATSVEWDFGDGNTSTQFNPTHTYQTGGNYTVTITAINGDCTDTFTINLTSVSVIENQQVASVSVFPNPVNSELQVVLNALNNGTATIRMMDATGRIVLNEVHSIATGVQNIALNATAFQAGLYFLQVEMNNENVLATRIVVQH